MLGRNVYFLGLDGYVGRSIKGVEVTVSGMLAAAHLLGPGGVRDFLRSNGRVDPVDGNSTRASDYMRRFPSYETPYEEIILAARPRPPGAGCGARSRRPRAAAARARRRDPLILQQVRGVPRRHDDR